MSSNRRLAINLVASIMAFVSPSCNFIVTNLPAIEFNAIVIKNA